MARRGNVIVSCAVTCSIHVPTVSEYLPITPEEIADGAIGAAEAGAAIVHLHARDLGDPGRQNSIYLGKGKLAKSNAEQVAKICGILTELSLEIASPHEARHMLGLKCAAHTDIPDVSAANAA